MFAYASAAIYAYNINPGAVKVVFVAPLASFMPGAPDSYVTVPNDGVIAEIQKSYGIYSGIPYPLIPNSFAK